MGNKVGAGRDMRGGASSLVRSSRRDTRGGASSLVRSWEGHEGRGVILG